MYLTHLKEHGAVLVCVRRLDVVGCAGMSAARRGPQRDPLPGHLLKTPCQAAAARTKLLLLLETRVLQDALWEGSLQTALTGTAGQALTWTTRTTTVTHQGIGDCTERKSTNTARFYLLAMTMFLKSIPRRELTLLELRLARPLRVRKYFLNARGLWQK